MTAERILAGLGPAFRGSARILLALVVVAFSTTAYSESDDSLEEAITRLEADVVAWRRDIHQHPELSNREFRTGKLVAAHLQNLGLQVRTGVAHTGVTGYLQGRRPGPVIALRADMDALPITEETDVPFRSVATATYRGEKVGVMHACGHDAHTAILMGVAQVLAGVRDSLPGGILFIFQPAEEGPPAGEEGGAALMLKEGLFDDYQPEAVFGLHVTSRLHVGDIGYRSGPALAAADSFHLLVHGRQTHGSRPWEGLDPIVTAAQLVNALQTIVSRRLDITSVPAIVTVGAIKGGVRSNIIPPSVEMVGTIRTYTPEHRKKVIEEMERLALGIGEANGTSIEFSLDEGGVPVTFNDPALLQRMLPSLESAVSAGGLREMPLITGAEDFSYFAEAVPGLFFFVGVTSSEQDVADAAPNHSAYFDVDERALPIGLRALTRVAVDYLQSASNTSSHGPD